jgi:uncharacterized protein YbaA (DUF1428 family)
MHSSFPHQRCYNDRVFATIHAIFEKSAKAALKMPALEKRTIWWDDVCYNKIGEFLTDVPDYDDEMFIQNYCIFNILADRNVTYAIMNFQSWLENTPMKERLNIWYQAWGKREKRYVLLQKIEEEDLWREWRKRENQRETDSVMERMENQREMDSVMDRITAILRTPRVPQMDYTIERRSVVLPSGDIVYKFVTPRNRLCR